MGLAALERKKYEAAWSHDNYRVYSPGEEMLPLFRQMVRKRGTLLDIGAGTGRAGQQLEAAGWRVTLMDHVDARETDLPLIKQCLWGRWGSRTWDYGYCCDVMEHIPEEKVDQVLKSILVHCDRVFFSIHFEEDQFGAVVGHPLHLTVRPFTWWRDKLGEYREVRDARDLIGMGTFYV